MTVARVSNGKMAEGYVNWDAQDTERWYWLSETVVVERATAEAPTLKSRVPIRIMKAAKSSPLIYPNDGPTSKVSVITREELPFYRSRITGAVFWGFYLSD